MKSIKIITKTLLCLAILPFIALADDGLNIVIAPESGPEPYCYGWNCGYYGNDNYYYGDGYYGGHDGHYHGYHDGHHDGHDGGHHDGGHHGGGHHH